MENNIGKCVDFFRDGKKNSGAIRGKIVGVSKGVLARGDNRYKVEYFHEEKKEMSNMLIFPAWIQGNPFECPKNKEGGRRKPKTNKRRRKSKTNTRIHPGRSK